MINKQQIINLLQQFADGTISRNDFDELVSYFKLRGNDEDIFTAMDGVWKNIQTEEDYTQDDADRFYQNLVQANHFKENTGKTIKRTLWPRYAAAASIVVALSAGIYFFNEKYFANTPAHIANTNKDIHPGKNKAILTLGNGEVIQLSDQKEGVVIDAGKLAYNDGTDVSDIAHTTSANDVKLNTPRGGTYRVVLPDGTQVWLNAATSLTFPVQFSQNERRVLLNGEAYFEVTRDQQHPFIVETNKQEVKVLGTHFNITGYADDGTTKTTLLEGSVHIMNFADIDRRNVILKPGQQSVITGKALTVFEVDTEEAVAWKNGTFLFTGQRLEEIMKQVERWYDVEVVYEDKGLKQQAFRGTISRFKNISQLLEVLESTGSVHFNINGRRITVMQ